MLNVQEKAQELASMDRRIGEMYDQFERDYEMLDFANDWREEFHQELEAFMLALAAGDQTFFSCEFPEGFFENWDWVQR